MNDAPRTVPNVSNLDDYRKQKKSPPPSDNPPAFNAPTVILVLLAVLIVIHVIKTFLLDDQMVEWVLLTFSFLPVRYDVSGAAASLVFPGGIAGDIWTFITYSFLHADWSHLMMNGFWMLAFATPLAQRFGTVRFLLFSAVGSIGGALLHLATSWGDFVPMIGASAAISAHTGALLRFAFAPYAPLGQPRSSDPLAVRMPATPLARIFTYPRAAVFAGIWFAINLGYAALNASDALGGSVAWQAHIGGFIAGLLVFPLLDPVRKA